jgi:cell division cycle 20-like protein 1, cofactor of APC complex
MNSENNHPNSKAPILVPKQKRSLSQGNKQCLDRFIPNAKRSYLLAISAEENKKDKKYRCLLETALFDEPNLSRSEEMVGRGIFSGSTGLFGELGNQEVWKNGRILSFGSVMNAEKQPFFDPKNDISLEFDSIPYGSDSLSFATKEPRKIGSAPYKVLDAPGLQDDFYCHSINWSQLNCISIGLADCVFCWNASTQKSFKLASLGRREKVTSLASSSVGNYLSVGGSDSTCVVYNVETLSKAKEISCHVGRVGVQKWQGNHVLATGGKDCNILISDLRSQTPYEVKLKGHKQEICGLDWSINDYMLASGANDNKVIVWDTRKPGEICRFSDHKAAVKALAWSHYSHNTLASGGGTTDKTIKIWNTSSGKLINSIDTGSQVCSLLFSKSTQEIVSTHGFSLNQIEIWGLPSFNRVARLTGHTSRVMYMCMSPDGESIVTGSGDETLRFWKIFPPRVKARLAEKFGVLGSSDFR